MGLSYRLEGPGAQYSTGCVQLRDIRKSFAQNDDFFTNILKKTNNFIGMFLFCANEDSFN